MNPIVMMIVHLPWMVVAISEILGNSRISYRVDSFPGEFSCGGFLALTGGTVAAWWVIGVNKSVELMVVFLAVDIFFLILSFMMARQWWGISYIPLAKGFSLGLTTLVICFGVYFGLSLI